MSYLWTHEPDLSAAPTDVVKHHLHEDGNLVFEMAVLKLENDKFLFINFSTEDKNDATIGITDYEEFDNVNEAVILFDTLIGE